jgi:NAD(P)-dependent dehydrogenase (short-subunit alcohol dehydrogenase family)
VLVNNAGIGGPRAAIEDIDDDGWDRTIAVNLTGMFYCIREAARVMKPQKSGCIINISTGSVRTGLPMRLPYVASKQGVMGMTHNVARELGPFNIRCNAILPGLIDNARGRSLVARAAQEAGKSFEEAEAEMLKYISLRCWIDPLEIADTALFFASHAGRHISGQFLGVCGNIEWEN